MTSERCVSGVDGLSEVNYSLRMVDGVKLMRTREFDRWLRKLAQRNAADAARVGRRLQRIEDGIIGDVKHFGAIGEIRIHDGPGYRVYFLKHEGGFILLCGGRKASQERDLDRARKMAKELRDDLREE